ncbi:hypothetical protein CEF21_05380 [Bacillus sp. FJAT-42376]|nr:hypothetical protein CEF21_05380 [Bacillus sp. FJAT-42376]
MVAAGQWRGSVPTNFTALKLWHLFRKPLGQKASQTTASVPRYGEESRDWHRASPQQFYRMKATAPPLQIAAA